MSNMANHKGCDILFVSIRSEQGETMTRIYKLDKWLYWRGDAENIELENHDIQILYRFASDDHREKARKANPDAYKAIGVHEIIVTGNPAKLLCLLIKNSIRHVYTTTAEIASKLGINTKTVSGTKDDINDKIAEVWFNEEGSNDEFVFSTGRQGYLFKNWIVECDEYGIELSASGRYDAYDILTDCEHGSFDFEDALPIVDKNNSLKDIIKECEAVADGEQCFIPIVGPAGAGKSRLALELCKVMYRDKRWQTMWVSHLHEEKGSLEEKLKDANGKLLIILDDIQFCLDKLNVILQYLYSRANPGIKKVCFIYTSRDDQTDMLKALIKDSKYKHITVKEKHELSYWGKEEGEAIFNNYIEKHGPDDKKWIIQYALEKSLIDSDLTSWTTESDKIIRKAIWEQVRLTLDRVDPFHRPLFILFITDAVCHGLDNDEWSSKTNAIDYAIEKENKRIESLLVEANGITNKFVIDDYSNTIRIIRAIGTLVGGASIDSLDAFMGKNTAEIKYLLRKSDFVSSDEVLPVKPDIIGEYYVDSILLDEILVSDDLFNSIMKFALSQESVYPLNYIRLMVKDTFRDILPARLRDQEKFIIGHIRYEAFLTLTNAYKSLLRHIYGFETPVSPEYKSAFDHLFPDDLDILKKDYLTESAIIALRIVADIYKDKNAIAVVNGQNDHELKMDCGHVKSYYGKAVYGKATGNGRCIWPDGTIYEGTFYGGELGGKGHFLHTDGREYSCELRDGFRYGYGTYVWPDLTRYEGFWFNGRRNGRGKIWYKGKIYYEGVWHNDVLFKRTPPNSIDDSLYQMPQHNCDQWLYDRGSIINNYSDSITLEGSEGIENEKHLERNMNALKKIREWEAERLYSEALLKHKNNNS